MDNVYLDKMMECLANIKIDVNDKDISYNELVDILVNNFITIKRKQKKIFFVGNGGSAGIAMHMQTDFLKNGKMRVYGMHDPAVLTCFANDYGYEYVFSKQLENVADHGDGLIAISSSGESENILRCVEKANSIGCSTVTFSGFDYENKLHSMGDVNIYVPSHSYGIVESIHQIILQQIVDILKEKWVDICV